MLFRHLRISIVVKIKNKNELISLYFILLFILNSLSMVNDELIEFIIFIDSFSWRRQVNGLWA